MKSDLTMTAIIESIAAEVALRLRNQNTGGVAGQIVPRLLTVDQAATYLGRSKNAVQHMVAARKLPVVRDGHRVFLDVRELDKWIEGSTEPAEF